MKKFFGFCGILAIVGNIGALVGKLIDKCKTTFKKKDEPKA